LDAATVITFICEMIYEFILPHKVQYGNQTNFKKRFFPLRCLTQVKMQTRYNTLRCHWTY